MKITHAVWEKRNMGVECNEITIQRMDTEESFTKKKSDIETEYIVVKLPSDMSELNFFLQKSGYTYVETMISLYRDTSIPKLSSINERIIQNMSYSIMNDFETEELYNEIRNGMFTKDRVSVDHAFTKEQSNNRYVGWINDEINNGAQLFKIKYRNKIVGFFTMKEKEEKVFDSVLAGMYQSKQMVGIGLAMDYFEIMEANRNEGKKVLASVSTNNLSALMIALQLGYSIDKLENIYVKHCKK